MTAQTCSDVDEAARNQYLQAFNAFKHSHMCAPVLGFCAPSAPQFFSEEDTHANEVNQRYFVAPLPELQKEASPSKSGCRVPRSGNKLQKFVIVF